MRSLGLRPSQIRALDRKARRNGKTAPEYVRSLIERDLRLEKSFDEILAPIRDDFRKRGITEAQLDGIVNRARGPAPRTKSRGRR